MDILRQKYLSLQGVLDERTRRLWAAVEARTLGRGGVALVVEATGLAPRTVLKGLVELQTAEAEGMCLAPLMRPAGQRIRQPGAGRRPKTETDPKLLHALEFLVAPATRGDPESPLRWTSKSHAHLAEELNREGHQVSESTVRRLLRYELRYSLHANRKTEEGKKKHPDRDAQFQYINARATLFQANHQPVISVDAKKTEKLGNMKNAGREWAPEGHVEKVRVYDFLDKTLGKAIPYGVYDELENTGWVNVGIDHNTPQFAVESIRRWWQNMGASLYPNATDLLITADSGSSNSYKCTIWKTALQTLADETGLRISVSHFPPGTSKWNKIEHRMFSQITMNWRGRPLTSYEVVIELIGSTKTKTGLNICVALDKGEYPKGRHASEEELSQLSLRQAQFHGEWNYRFSPRQSQSKTTC